MPSLSPWSEAQRAVAPIEAQIETIADERLSVLLAEIKAMGRRIGGVGVVARLTGRWNESAR
jgi:hypothetical protein